MKRFGRLAARAVEAYLRDNTREPAIPLHTLSVVADRAAIDAGRKSELYESLYGYLALLPAGTRHGWVKSGSGGLYKVFNPFNPDSAKVATYEPIAGPFDAAVDLGPMVAPRLPASC